jgi:hypothetical protein
MKKHFPLPKDIATLCLFVATILQTLEFDTIFR